MALPTKPIDQISESDLLALIQANEAESKIIDYKETLPGNSDSDKKEFLYDVSSFANSLGGHLIFGMKAKDGVPSELLGIAPLNADAEKLRLHQIIQSGIQPRIPGVEIHDVKLANGKAALLARIPRSWSSPHMVTFQGASKFYSRNSAGKYPLDVSEIRSAFLLSETVAEKIRGFRSDRLAAILADQSPVMLQTGQKLVLHLLSPTSFAPGFSIDLKQVYKTRAQWGQPMSVASGFSAQYTFDGVVSYEDNGDRPSNVYVQVFRSGCIEVVNCHSLYEYRNKKRFHAEVYESAIVDYLPTLFSVLKEIQVESPFFVALSLINIRGFTIDTDGRLWIRGPRHIEKDHLIVPETMIESSSADIPSAMKSVFDAVWNACGYAGSSNYDEAGKWKNRRYQV